MNRALFLLLVCSWAVPASAQGIGYVIDAGGRSDVHGNGQTRSALTAGLSIGTVVFGHADRYFSFLVPVAGEFRVSTLGHIELNADADVMMRVGLVSVGAGLDVRAMSAGGGITDAGDDVTLIDPIAGGYSVAAKLNLWPDGRLFLQGRYVWLQLSLDERGPQPVCADYICVTSDPVDFLGGNELKLALGWVFSGEGHRDAWMLRLQASQRVLQFERVEDNRNGVYDRTSQALSLGYVHYF